MALVEMPEFTERAEKFLSAAQRQQLLWRIAANPEAGEVMPGTSGVRKSSLGGGVSADAYE